jgi:hypothetical protein
MNGIACKYLSDDGKRCAAGSLIPPDEYFPKLEGTGNVLNLPDRFTEFQWMLPFIDLIVKLQSAHDSAAIGLDFLRDFLRTARAIATEFDLDPTVAAS